MDKPKSMMIAIGVKPKGEPPSLSTPGAKPKPAEPPVEQEPEPVEQSAKDKLAYLRGVLKECMAVLGEEEEPEEMEEVEE